MKTFFKLFLCLFVGLGIISCSDKKNDEPTPTPEQETKTETIEIGYEATSHTAAFTAATTWRATTSADWCQLARTQGGSGQISLVVKFDQNLTGQTRKGVISVTSIEGNNKIYQLTVTQQAKEVVSSADVNPDAPAAMRLNASGLVKQIVVGWNIGNSCESGIWDGWNGNHMDIETNWGNPKISREFVAKLKAEGFNAVRIPVRWYVHADDQMNIKTEWLARVKEIVDYAVSQDMYVILNSHHDSWFDRLPQVYDEQSIRTRFANMWKQIAEYFKNYDEHLIFAGNNEMIYLNADGSENWGTPSTTQKNVLAGLMQIFVDTVRATGGNNTWRNLLIQPWAASFDHAQSGFSMPKDATPNRLMLEFHYYTWTYSTEAAGNDNKYFWGKDYSSYKPWYSNGESQVDALMDKVKTLFLDNGIPAIMTEFGCVQHNKSTNEAKCDESRAYYHKYVVSAAKKRGIPAFYWDNNGFNGDGENFGLIDRKTLNISARSRIALDGILQGAR